LLALTLSKFALRTSTNLAGKGMDAPKLELNLAAALIDYG
jgi:hypothetical protein